MFIIHDSPAQTLEKTKFELIVMSGIAPIDECRSVEVVEIEAPVKLTHCKALTDFSHK